eukprot:3373031-Rhodomonas_salina.1
MTTITAQQLADKMTSLRPTQTIVKTAPVGMEEEKTTTWVRNEEGKWVEASGPATAAVSHPVEPLGPLRSTHTEMHGFRGNRQWEAPQCVLRDGSLARTGYTTINRDEFEDTPAVLAAKVKMLASMIRQAKFPIAYTGAGISTESGIPDYATGSSASRAALVTRHIHCVEAGPSDAHLVLTRLHSAGLMKAWVQQNHDGLPQKAGFPQSDMNEIHGAWFDPSNPVVPMAGSLRDDLFANLLQLENDADFCICVGTSLSGMNADRAAITTGEKAKKQFETTKTSVSPGLVIINLQRTQCDNVAALRIFAKASVVLNALAEELALPPMDSHARDAEIQRAIAQNNDVFVLPYSPEDGSLIEGEQASSCACARLRAGAAQDKGFELDLREDSVVRISRGKFAGDLAVVTGKNRQGHYRLKVSHDLGKGRVKAQVPVLLGKWWVLEGMRGEVP